MDDGLETQVINWLDDEEEAAVEAEVPAPSSVTRRPTASAAPPPPKPQAAPPKAPAKPARDEKPFDAESPTPAPVASAAKPAAPAKEPEKPAAPQVDRDKGYRDVGGKKKYEVVSAMKVTDQGDPEDQRINFRAVSTTAHFNPLEADEQAQDEFSVVDPSMVRLYVEELNNKGVSLIFNSAVIKLDRFRGSMPMRCAVCGQGDGVALTARPLVWVDRIKEGTPAGEIEVLYQIKVKPAWTGLDVIRAMTTMDKFSPPLGEPVPYYVCDAHADKTSIRCRTFDTARGLFCRATLPNASVARDWIACVNGTINRQYVRVAEHVERIDGGAWRELDDLVRQKIAVWFEFQDGEQFLAYFMDPDFMVKDAGLAGVVVTDQRLVYCKYQKKGAIPLDSDGDLIAAEIDAHFELQHRLDDKTTKLVRIRKKDTEQLMGMLAQMRADGICQLRLLRA
ncbi:MAG: hypothetical protein GC159_20485 [Phycisphaera sp.]|nr:hypothetical protein [Phycisphaera sp.]